MTTGRENADALVGVAAVALIVFVCVLFYVKAERHEAEKQAPAPEPTIAATPTPEATPTPTASMILGAPDTLEAVFELLKDTMVTPEQFDGLFSMAGVSGLPSPPAGWKYIRTKDGIGLRKSEKINGKVK